MAAFRETYSELHELRSLAPSVKMIALTVTATASTRKTIAEVLMMENAHIVYENPGKINIAYSVHYMEKEKSVEDYFQWLAEEIKEVKSKATRTIIYCQTIKQCGLIYATIRGMLGNDLYADSTKSPGNVVLEILHSCSPEKKKQGSSAECFSESRFLCQSVSGNNCLWHGRGLQRCPPHYSFWAI